MADSCFIIDTFACSFDSDLFEVDKIKELAGELLINSNMSKYRIWEKVANSLEEFLQK